MQTGRPAKKERTPFGQRLHTLREQAGLSQQQLADGIAGALARADTTQLKFKIPSRDTAGRWTFSDEK